MATDWPPLVVGLPFGPTEKPFENVTLTVFPLGKLYVWLPDAPADPWIPLRLAWKDCVWVPAADAPKLPRGPVDWNPCA